MPLLEITSATAPKDIKAFTKRLSATFSEFIGKPESVSLNFIYRLFFHQIWREMYSL